MDEQLRDLERRVQLGEPGAQRQLLVEQFRRGVFNDVIDLIFRIDTLLKAANGRYRAPRKTLTRQQVFAALCVTLQIPPFDNSRIIVSMPTGPVRSPLFTVQGVPGWDCGICSDSHLYWNRISGGWYPPRGQGDVDYVIGKPHDSLAY
jgi:hypothetical protein